jgi:hypothetical protein
MGALMDDSSDDDAEEEGGVEHAVQDDDDGMQNEIDRAWAEAQAADASANSDSDGSGVVETDGNGPTEQHQHQHQHQHQQQPCPDLLQALVWKRDLAEMQADLQGMVDGGLNGLMTKEEKEMTAAIVKAAKKQKAIEPDTPVQSTTTTTSTATTAPTTTTVNAAGTAPSIAITVPTSADTTVDADAVLTFGAEKNGTCTDKGVYVEAVPWVRCSCPKEACTQCRAEVATCNLTDHAAMCVARVVPCPVCSKQVKHAGLSHHLSACRGYTIACYDCTIPTTRGKLSQHRHEWHSSCPEGEEGSEPACGVTTATPLQSPLPNQANAPKVVLGSTYKDHLQLLLCPCRQQGCRFRTENRAAWDAHWATECKFRATVCLSCNSTVEWTQYDDHFTGAGCKGHEGRPVLFEPSEHAATFDPAAVLAEGLARRKLPDPRILEYGQFVLPKDSDSGRPSVYGASFN